MRTALEWVKEAAFFGLKPYDQVAQRNGRMVALDTTAPMERRVDGLGTFLWQSWRAELENLPYDSPLAFTHRYAAEVLSQRPAWLPRDVRAAFMEKHLGVASELGELHCGAAAHSKRLFEINEIAAFANAAIKPPEAPARSAAATTRSIKDALFLAMSANGGRWLVAPLHYAQARSAEKSVAKCELSMLCELGVCLKAGNGQYHVIKSRYELLP